jgi:hypothetical protein
MDNFVSEFAPPRQMKPRSAHPSESRLSAAPMVASETSVVAAAQPLQRTASMFGIVSSIAFLPQMAGFLGLPLTGLAWVARKAGKENIATALGRPLQELEAIQARPLFSQASQAKIAGLLPNSAANDNGMLTRLADWRLTRLDASHARISALPEAKEAKGVIGFFKNIFTSDAPAKLEKIAGSQSFWTGLKQQGAIRTVLSSAGKVSIGRALLLVGVVAGSAAALTRSKADNVQASGLLSDLASDVYGVPAAQITGEMIHGKDAPELLKLASKRLGEQQRGNWLSGAGQVVEQAMWLNSSGLGMFLAMSGGMTADLFKKEHPLLQAHTILKAAESGKGTLPPEQKLQLVTMLVGASPDVAAHGEARNKMAAPIAAQMIAENLSVKDMVREIASPEAIATRAKAASEAKNAITNASSKAAVTVDEAQKAIAKAKVSSISATEVPTKIAASDRQIQGRLSAPQIAAESARQ